MTLYLTDNTPPAEIERAKASGFVHAVKYYPAGATTNSDSGVTALDRVYPVLAAMERHGVVLSLHGEVTDPAVDMFDRERVFVDTLLARIVRDFPGTEDRARAHHDARGRSVRARERRPRRRHDYAAASAVVAQRAVRRRFPATAFLLPADPQARSAPAGAGRGGDFGQSALFPRHRLGAACEAYEGELRAAAPAATRRHAALELYARSVRRRRTRSTGSRVSRATSAPISTACRATRITVTLRARAVDRSGRVSRSATAPSCRCARGRRCAGGSHLTNGSTAPDRWRAPRDARRLRSPKPARPSLPPDVQTAGRRGKSGLRRAGCRVTPGRYKSPLARPMKARNRATETSRFPSRESG